MCDFQKKTSVEVPPWTAQKLHLRLIWKGNLIRENALLIFEKSRHIRLPHVCFNASTPTRLHQRVCANASIPTGLRRRVCADASAPTRLRRCVCSGASKYGFSLKNFDSARDLLKKLEKTSSKITTFVKNDHPYRSCGISAVNSRPLQ